MENDLLDYFIEHTDERFNKLEQKLDELIEFRYQIIGGSAVVAGIISLVMTIVVTYIAK